MVLGHRLGGDGRGQRDGRLRKGLKDEDCEEQSASVAIFADCWKDSIEGIGSRQALALEFDSGARVCFNLGD